MQLQKASFIASKVNALMARLFRHEHRPEARLLITFNVTICESFPVRTIDVLNPLFGASTNSGEDHSDLLISLTQLGQILLLPVQTLFLFEGNPMSYLGSCGWTLGRSLDRGLSGRIHLFEGP